MSQEAAYGTCPGVEGPGPRTPSSQPLWGGAGPCERTSTLGVPWAHAGLTPAPGPYRLPRARPSSMTSKPDPPETSI